MKNDSSYFLSEHVRVCIFRLKVYLKNCWINWNRFGLLKFLTVVCV